MKQRFPTQQKLGAAVFLRLPVGQNPGFVVGCSWPAAKPATSHSLVPTPPEEWGKESKNKCWKLVGWDKDSFVSKIPQRLLWRKLTPSHPAMVGFCNRQQPSGAEEVRDCPVWLQNWPATGHSKAGGVSRKTWLRKSRTQLTKRTKKDVRKGGGGASDAGAELPLQPLEKSCWKRQIFTLQPVGDPMLEWWIFPEGRVAHEEPTLEQIYPKRLQPMGRAHAGAEDRCC